MAKEVFYFLGAWRSNGKMKAKDGSEITWDNVIVQRTKDVDPNLRESGVGREAATACKIKAEDFEEVTGESIEEFFKKANSRLNKPIIVYFGEMRGAKDDRKADTVFLRFVGLDGKITI